jgi:hypothetical protein
VPDLESGLTADFRFLNTVRLNSAIGYLTPADKLAGRAEAIWAEPKRKLAAAEARRQAASRERPQRRSRESPQDGGPG